MAPGQAAGGEDGAGGARPGGHHHADHDHHRHDGPPREATGGSSSAFHGRTMTGRPRTIALGERLFLASALDRVAMAAVLVALIWLAVRWAAA